MRWLRPTSRLYVGETSEAHFFYELYVCLLAPSGEHRPQERKALALLQLNSYWWRWGKASTGMHPRREVLKGLMPE